MTLADKVLPQDLLPDEDDILVGPDSFCASVRIEDSQWQPVNPDAIAEMVLTILAASPYARSGLVNCDIIFTSSDALAELNGKFRGKPQPTNVLAFPSTDDFDDQDRAFIGGIAIAFEVMAQEAAERAIPLAHHTTHLVLHGVLHLLGYDHEAEDERNTMEGIEIGILDGLGIPDPYNGS
ncbi:rRNA maturation RNase YbeY [Acuticoccus sp. MNP-M23]|uniref:rRNA maturation RNase YbeY n=1 Tax=Acuticoccus sp. MNP-M23 TaxID=3072793 RepID=UPI002815A343|nr:rRNA maturation RNase YbeY [Acuticoccus sp. MNP-M23]WMS43380.1 rRNA maturation RNase YbeY [Acuticoccus sp. MNP-M23]